MKALSIRVVTVMVIALIAVMPLQNIVVSVVAAEEAGTWIDGDAPALIVGDRLAAPFPPQCHDDIFYYHSYTKPDGALDPIGRQVPVAVCARSVGFGQVGSGYIKPNTSLAFRALTTASFSAGLVPNPYTPGFYFSQSSGSGSYIALFSSLASAGNFEKDDVINQLAYKLNPITVDQFLKDSAGNRISIRGGTAYSSDGTWLVTYAEALGLLRVNTRTHETLLFDTQKINFGLGFVPSIELSISDDGKTVIRSGIGNFPQTTKVFDLSGCQGAPFVNNGTNATPGCRSRLVQDNLSTLHPGYVGMANMRFSSDGKSVRGVAAIRNSSGVQEFYSATYSVAGHVVPKVAYLALGDSFSSGEGELDDSYYEEGTNETNPENKCHLSKRSYPYLISQSLLIADFHSVACSGAKIENYLQSEQYSNNLSTIERGKTWVPGLMKQQTYVGRVADARAITLSLSGNDIGFADKLKECITSLGTCKYAADPQERANVAKEIANLYDRLSGLYQQIIADTNGRTKVYVIGYPQIMSADLQCAKNVHFNGEEVTFARMTTQYLNDVIKAAADKAGVYYIDIEDSLEGTNLCSANAPLKSVNGLTAGDDISLAWWEEIGAQIITGDTSFGNEGYHPNSWGHALMADGISAATNGDILSFNTCPGQPDGAITCPKDDVVIPAPSAYFGASAANFVDWLNNPSLTVISSSERIVPRSETLVSESHSGRQIRLRVDSKLKPGSTVNLEIRSELVTLGSYVVSQNGTMDVTVTVPDTVPAGYHTIHLLGDHVTGEKIDYYQSVLVSGEEGDLDVDDIPDEQDPCGFVEASGVDEDRDGVDDACDPEIGEAPGDLTPPEVTGVVDREPNEHGWHNSDVTINWTATDPEPSSGQPTQPPATVANQEGTRTYASDESCDPAGNCASGSVELKIDKTAPALGEITWTGNPKSTLGTALISLPASDGSSGIAEAEYYLGDTDPGPGNGATMQLNDSGDTISVGFNTDFPTGVYKVTMRAKDKAGNWSATVSDYLVVYDPFGTRMTGKRTLIPSFANDNLPGLISDNQEDKAKFGFNVRYDQNGQIHKNSDFQFKYETGTKCHDPAKAQNCHTFELNATSIAWLTTQGTNNSSGIFQGTAKLEVDGTISDVVFRLTGLDGELLDQTSQDHLTLKIYAQDVNPNTAGPLYQASGEVLRGNIKIRKW